MQQKQILYKIVSFIDREELDFLDKIIKDIYFKTRRKIPRSEIIREIIHISKDLAQYRKEIIHEFDHPKLERR
ncbi:MAG: hypothetical protein JW734_09515 [Candidatus Omnitrophica bacterium]|nr:hypothetical protein [Candidatus Omnitrophota bacterium]